jgi:hypothetical protein
MHYLAGDRSFTLHSRTLVIMSLASVDAMVARDPAPARGIAHGHAKLAWYWVHRALID